MAIIALEGLWIPRPNQVVPSTIAYSGMLIDGTAEKVAFTFPVPKTGVLDQCAFRLGTVTQAPTNGIRVSFQDLSSGNPDGTTDQYRIVTSGLTTDAWIIPGLMTDTGADGGAKRSVTRGHLLSVVFQFESFSASDSLNIATISPVQISLEVSGYCYVSLLTAGWVRQSSSPVMALKYDDGSYGYIPGAYPFQSMAALSVNTSANPDEYGALFSFPMTVLVSGAWVEVRLTNVNQDFSVILYDTDGLTPLATVAVSGANWSSVAAVRQGYMLFPSDVLLRANQQYRLTVRADTANSLTVYAATVNVAAQLDMLDFGTIMYRTSRTTTAGVPDPWGENTAVRPMMGLVLSGIDIPVAAGGLGGLGLR